jgi:hypothetical protein
MANLTKTKTWEYIYNQRINQATQNEMHAGLLLAIKNALKSGTLTTPAQIVQTCNASTVSSSDLLNTVTDFTWGSGARTWFTLKFPGMGSNYQVCFHCGTSSTRSQLQIAVSPSAGFTGGTTTARPTATDEVLFLNGTWTFSSFTGLTTVFHLIQSSDGKNIRIIVYNSGVAGTYMFFETVAGAESWWTIPVIFGCKGSNSNQIDYGNFFSLANAQSYAGGAFSCFLGTLGWGSSGAGAAGLRLTSANSRTSKYHATEIAVASETASPLTMGVHGKLPDLWWGPSAGVTDGQTSPLDGSYQYVQYGHMIFPWNGQLPVVA